VIDQVTAVLLVPATLAVKVCVWPPKRDTLWGNTEMVTQVSDIGLDPRSVPEFSNFTLTLMCASSSMLAGVGMPKP